MVIFLLDNTILLVTRAKYYQRKALSYAFYCGTLHFSKTNTPSKTGYHPKSNDIYCLVLLGYGRVKNLQISRTLFREGHLDELKYDDTYYDNTYICSFKENTIKTILRGRIS